MNAPKAQGVAGFFKAAGGRFALGDVVIESANEYAAVNVVALDDQPLSLSRKLLVQVGTTARLTGWETKPATFDFNKGKIDGEQIVNTCRPPWRIANTRVTVTINNSRLRRATRVDASGRAAGKVPVEREGKKLRCVLPPDALCVVIE